MKKLLIGLTLLASMSAFAGNSTNESVQSRGLDALANIHSTFKAGNASEAAMSEFSKLMDQADDETQECLTKTSDLVFTNTNQNSDVDEELLAAITREMDQADDKGQSCLTDFSERLLK
jgi:hypothetical protein